MTTVLLIGASARPQTEQGPGQDRLLWIQHLMQEVVPELKHCRLTLEFTIDLDRDWDGYAVVGLKLWDSPGNQLGSLPPAPILEGLLNLDHGHETLNLKGPYARNDALDEVRAEVRSHPGWTERDVTMALQRRGARFPSDRREAFIQHVQPKRFARVFGPVRRVDVDFVRWIAGEPRDEDENPLLLWRVALETEGRNGHVERRALTFEPIRGRFVFLARAETELP